MEAEEAAGQIIKETLLVSKKGDEKYG